MKKTGAAGTFARPAVSTGLRRVPMQTHTLLRSQNFGSHAAVSEGRTAGPSADIGLALVGDALREPGRPLDHATRSFMEPRLGYDFSNVRIHTNDKAALSARSIDATAYTMGTNVAFAAGRYEPHTARGRHLLAHELTHVAQQSHASADQRMALAPAQNAAEREAESVASTVAAGNPLARPISAAHGGIQRISAGLIGGIVAGAAVAAAAAEVLLRHARPLTGPEITEAKRVFGSSLKYDLVRVAESTVMAVGGYARTPFNTIYLPPGSQKERTFAELMPWLIHEMTHTWQTQHGISVVKKTLTALKGASAYNYGGIKGLQDATKQGKHFLDFNTEQQADICSDYYSELKSGGDTSPYEPFIDEVKHGGMAVKRREEINDGVAPSGPNMMA